MKEKKGKKAHLLNTIPDLSITNPKDEPKIKNVFNQLISLVIKKKNAHPMKPTAAVVVQPDRSEVPV